MVCSDKEQRIRELIELYFEGETSLEQEREIGDFLSGSDVPADLLYAKAMFAGLGGIKEECCNKEISLTDEPIKTKGKRKRLFATYGLVGVAAAVLIVCGVKFAELSPQEPAIYCYLNGEPVTDPAVAAQQLEMAAQFMDSTRKIASNGIAKAQKASKPIEQIGKVAKIIDRLTE